MKKFKLKSHGLVFNVVKFYDAAGFIPSVKGISSCGKFQTCARIVDIDEVI